MQPEVYIVLFLMSVMLVYIINLLSSIKVILTINSTKSQAEKIDQKAKIDGMEKAINSMSLVVEEMRRDFSNSQQKAKVSKAAQKLSSALNTNK